MPRRADYSLSKQNCNPKEIRFIKIIFDAAENPFWDEQNDDLKK